MQTADLSYEAVRNPSALKRPTPSVEMRNQLIEKVGQIACSSYDAFLKTQAAGVAFALQQIQGKYHHIINQGRV